MNGPNLSTLTGARLPGCAGTFDIFITDGVVVAVRASQDLVSTGGSSRDRLSTQIDVGGLMLLPSLQEHHAHLDKALTADKIFNRTGDLSGAIEAWTAAEQDGSIEADEMSHRAEQALLKLVHSGVTKVRTHVNVGGSDPHLRNLKSVDSARRTLKSVIDVEVVALMHSPLTGPEGSQNRRMLDRAIEYGVDLIGGCPHLEPNPSGMIEYVVERSQRTGLPLDLHVDETLDPNMLTLESLCRHVLTSKLDLPVTASHCVSLSVQPANRLEEIARLIAESGVEIVALPQTNLFLQGWDHPVATPRGIAPLSALVTHDVKTRAGGDNVQDPFNPMGRSDPLETASLLVMAAHLGALDALDAVTTFAHPRTDRITDWLGVPADFVAVEAATIRQAVAEAPARRMTIKRGQVVAATTVHHQLVAPSRRMNT